MTRNYEIIERTDCPPRYRNAGKWRSVFDALPLTQALKFLFETQKEAKIYAVNLAGSLRKGRSPYKLSWRVIPNGEQWSLYVWKVLRETEGESHK